MTSRRRVVLLLAVEGWGQRDDDLGLGDAGVVRWVQDWVTSGAVAGVFRSPR
jgi:hypothetical protein